MRVHPWHAAVPVGLILLIPILAFPQEPPAPKEQPKQDAAQPRLDLYGDPLPEGAVGRMGTIRLRHASPVYSVAFSPNGQIVARFAEPFPDEQSLGGGRGGKLYWDPASTTLWFSRKGPVVELLRFGRDGRLGRVGVGAHVDRPAVRHRRVGEGQGRISLVDRRTSVQDVVHGVDEVRRDADVARLNHRTGQIGGGVSVKVAVGDDRLLITGGIELAIPRERTPDGRTRAFFSNRSLLYDVKKNRYQTLNSLPLAVADHGSVYVQGRLYVIGGEDSGYKTRTDFVQIGRLHP